MPKLPTSDVSTKDVKDSRKLVLGILAVAALLFVNGAILYSGVIQPVQKLRSDANWAYGKTKSEVRARMGEPWRAYAYFDWERVERENVTKSYVPEPPRIRCDEVLIYVELASMEILYIRNNVVVYVHSCGT